MSISLVLKTQYNSDGSANQAESAYYSILSFAAVSTLPVHAACIYAEEGIQVMNKAYYHYSEPEPINNAE